MFHHRTMLLWFVVIALTTCGTTFAWVSPLPRVRAFEVVSSPVTADRTPDPHGNVPTPSSSSWNRSLRASRSSEGIADKVIDDASSEDTLTAAQRDFVLGYLNQHHTAFLMALVTAFSDMGTEMAHANVWSGGSYTIPSAALVDVTATDVTLEATIQRRGSAAPEARRVTIPLEASPIPERRRSYDVDSPMIAAPEWSVPLRPPTAMDRLVRQLCRWAWIVRQPALTGKLLQLAIQLGGRGIGKLPDNMYVWGCSMRFRPRNEFPHHSMFMVRSTHIFARSGT
jgi:hypothetical protein